MKRKGMIIAAIAVVLIVGGFLAYRWIGSARAAEAGSLQTATVGRGSLTSTLSASGNTRSGQSATITWETSGKVGEVSLQPGDRVKADQVLAALDPNTLSTELIQAKRDLIDAQQALDTLLNSTLSQAKAQQAVEDAQNALSSLSQSSAENSSQALLALTTAQEALKDAQRNREKMNYPKTSNDLVVEKAETNYQMAKQNYKEALKEFQKVQNKKLTNPARVQALARLVDAETAMNSTLGIYNWYLLPYSDADIAGADAELAVAEANLAAAQAKWENYKNGTSSAAVAMAEATLGDAQREWERVKDGPNEADVEAAQAAVDSAQAALEKAQLLAPFAGTITEVDIAAGDLVSPGDSAFRIDDLDSVYVDLQISEVDLASLEIHQPATLEFDAIPDTVYPGEVVRIGMIGVNSQGVVNYPVTVRITDVDENIRPGMTALVNIITQQVDDVLLVPNRAIRTGGGQRTVTVLFEGQQISIPVSVGLTGDSMSAVTSDQLREGDVVLVTGAASSSGSQNNSGFRNGAGIDGGGFPGGGGAPPVMMP